MSLRSPPSSIEPTVKVSTLSTSILGLQLILFISIVAVSKTGYSLAHKFEGRFSIDVITELDFRFRLFNAQTKHLMVNGRLSDALSLDGLEMALKRELRREDKRMTRKC